MISERITLADYQQQLARAGRVVVRDFLEEAKAEQLFTDISNIEQWDLAVNTPAGPAAIDATEFESAPERERQKVHQEIHKQALDGFSYYYGRYELIPGEPICLKDVRDFIASDGFMSFIKQLTGDAHIERADAHATVYRTGHFLKKHDDTYAGKNRRYAYVIGLTPYWQVDWGGLLHFIDSDGSVSDVFVPAFNTLTIFKVPQNHFVSIVTNFANESRYSVTGWIFGPDDGD
ncbi:MAG: 2OG-Fe(II) oxygenase [Gammaproteobacteria bacterium]|nr:2OG-Fe(II) oxygenase [Gammaproteobacteria bacterium]